MRIITRLMLAFVAVCSLSLTACKDYDEDNYNNALIAAKTVDEALNEQIKDMKQQLTDLKTKDQELSDAIKNCSTNCANEKKLIDEKIAELEKRIGTSCDCGNLEEKVDAIIRNNEYVKAFNSRLTDVGDSLKVIYEKVALNKDTANAQIDSAFNAIKDVRDELYKYYDLQIEIVYDNLDDHIQDFNAFKVAAQAADSVLAEGIDSLAGVTKDLQLQVDDILSRLDSLEDARAKQVTSIVVQQVSNPAFGTYNSILTNVQSNMLALVYGDAASAISFPSEGPDKDFFQWKTGAKLMNNVNGNAGKLYVTINPNTVDFDGMEGVLSLVNSKDEECPIYLENVMSASAFDNDELKLGYSRAAEVKNGLYVVDASIKEEDVDNPNVHLNIDKSAIRSALGELVSSKNASGAKLALKDVAATTIQTIANLQPTAYGVKSSWTDAYGEHAVYSNYNIAAIAYKPLGFNSLDGVFDKESNGAYWRLYDKAKNLATNAAKNAGTSVANMIKTQMNLDNLQATISDLQTRLKNAKLNKIEGSNGKIEVTTKVNIPTQTVDLDLKIPVEIEIDPVKIEGNTYTTEIDVPVRIENGELVTEKKKISIEVTAQEINIGKINKTIEYKEQVSIKSFDTEVTIDITKQVNEIFNNMLGDINNSFDSVNALFDSLNSAMDDVNAMFDAINNLSEKLESGSYLNGVFNYLDKAAQKVANVTPKMLKPALLVNSDSGFGFAGFEGAPTKVSGNVVLFPTTYTMELLSPIFRKYIRVNGGKGHFMLPEFGTDKAIDITDELVEGKNTIEFRALDYQGTEWVGYYEIEK